MIKQRKTYTKPVLNAEAFVPDTYVAVCPPVNGKTEYWLACDGGNDNNDHSTDGCLRSTAYKITVNENTKIIESIWEMENDANPNYHFPGGYAQNITVDGYSASRTPLTDPNGDYKLTWTTMNGWMKHTGTLKLSTAVNVNLS